MVKPVFTIVTFIFQCLSLYSQPVNFVWAKSMGAGTADIGFSVKADASGNVYTTGFFTGSVDFDPGPGVFQLSSSGSQDIFITKFNAAGNFLWARQIGGNSIGCSAVAYSLVLNTTGEFYLTGNFEGIIDFDPGVNQFNMQSLSGNWREIFVCKLDAGGNFIWAKQIGGTGSRGLLATAATVDLQGNIITTGFISGTVDFDPGPGIFDLLTGSAAIQSMFISKLDANGNFVWARLIGDGRAQCWGFSVASDQAGNIYTTGGFGGTVVSPGTVDFDPGPSVFELSSNVFSTECFVLKLNGSGSFQWVSKLSYGSNNMGRSITLDKLADFIYVTGYCTINNSDLFITRLNPDGSPGWHKTIGGSGYEEAHSITTNESGQIYVTGFFEGTVNFDSGNASGATLIAAGRSDVFIFKADELGNFKWVKRAGGNEAEAGYSIDVDAGGNVYTTGSYSTVADFDPGPNSYNLNAAGETDIFVLKLGACTAGSSFTLTVSACRSFTLNSQVYSASGNYLQTLTNAAGCDSILNLNLTIKPAASSAIAKTICSGQFFEGYSQTGVYKDTFVAANGCDSIRTLTLSVQHPKLPNLGADRNLCDGDSMILDPGVFLTYSWQDGSTQNKFVVRQSGLYKVTVKDNCGATGTDEVMITKKACDIYFPSGFSPNNDGRNDLFKILTQYNLKNYRLRIFDRWGEIVFETTDIARGWNGTRKGQELDPGVYVWFCEFMKPGSSELTLQKGVVSLIR